jgi:hypothetical protein
MASELGLARAPSLFDRSRRIHVSEVLGLPAHRVPHLDMGDAMAQLRRLAQEVLPFV